MVTCQGLPCKRITGTDGGAEKVLLLPGTDRYQVA